ncbi:hypothetical protein [Nonomuraea zeae]|uniref:Uncharacterized protein n=1 Tax=Nonomuraea zeae TaxID=1642303 RepID=A0A5S4FAD2_9ACTN|nr:hypothetical protein [Nonomuraea zeae]TMR14112.1 hypothetical protein ETD85_57075 [Nonomuraea zeae]
MFLETLQTITDHLVLLVLAFGVFFLFLGTFVLTKHRVPHWMPSSARRARWKPYGWSNICAAAWMATQFIPRELNVPPLLGMALLVPAMGFLIAWPVLLLISMTPQKAP